MSQLKARLSDIGTLPAAPGVTLEILRLTEREDAEMGDLAEVVSKDPAIGSKLLKTANSSALGRQGSVTNFHEAVMLLGTRRVNMLALSFSLTSASSRPANDAFNYTRFWTVSAVNTVAARSIAGMYAKNLVDEAFVAGLLCDLGQLVLAECAADLYAPVLRAQDESERKVNEIEGELLGATHASLAAELFADWGLPPVICQAIGGHHDPDAMEAEDPRVELLARILHVSSCCSDLYAEGADADVDEIVALGSRYFEMDKAACENLFDSLRNEVSEFLTILDPSNMDAAEADRLRARASERLMEQSLDLEHRFESVSTELAQMSRRNAELETKANYDPLTKLKTRGYFEELAAEHLIAPADERGSTGLLMMDVDYFKEVNDRFGHLAGDAVLAAVGEALTEVFEPECVISRWGGDEFIALCPKTGVDELLELAEKLLQRIAEIQYPWDSNTIRPSLSIGGIVLSRGAASPELRQLTRQADLQLYRAKEGGRNRACVAEASAAEA